jgi:hypothetical protein
MAVDYRVHVMTVPGAHPGRDAVVKALTAAGACVHPDPERSGLMQNWRGAVDCASRDGTDWSVIVSDDAEPLPGWDRHLPRALGFSPRPLLGLIHFGGYGRRAAEEGFAYAAGPGMLWGGAIAYRTALLPDLAEYARRFTLADPSYPHDDEIGSLFAARFYDFPAMTARALFDHLEVPSLMGHPPHFKPNRRPGFTIRETGPAWNTPGTAKASAWLSDRGKAIAAQLAAP